MITIEIEQMPRGSYVVIINSDIKIHLETEEKANTFVIELLKQTERIGY